MKWRQPADKHVVGAVVASFCEPIGDLQTLFLRLSRRQWEQSLYWLDASGMALYLLRQLEGLQLADLLPAAIIARLRQNLADNRDRSASMFLEYSELNRAFQKLGIDYCNLKGFTLSPGSCPDPSLRCQLDLDFLVDGGHLERCQEVLTKRGYLLRDATPTVREFKADGDQLPIIADFYKPKRQRCIEIHFRCQDAPPYSPIRDQRLDRLKWQVGDGISFPALPPGDQFIAQAAHLFGHLCSPTTRLAWVLEHKRNIEAHAHDREFWSEIGRSIAGDRSSALAVGAAALIVVELFGGHLPNGLREIANHIPERVQLWLQRYGRQAVLADFPGTKLHLLLREEVSKGAPEWKQAKRKLLLPLARPSRIVQYDAGSGASMRIRSELYQLRYELFRLRFHLVEGVRYALEAARWRDSLKQSAVRLRSEVPVQTQTAVKH